MVLGRQSFGSLLAAYTVIDILTVGIEVYLGDALLALLPEWTAATSSSTSLVKDVAIAFITAQVGIVGVISIAVALVALLAQREGLTADIKVYYHESMAYEVIASSLALLLVLCVQLLWPMQFVAHHLDFGGPSLAFKLGLTAVHASWLAVNICAMAHFVSESLNFLNSETRRKIRERFTANQVAPRDLAKRLRQVLYQNGCNGLIQGLEDRCFLLFGSRPDELATSEIFETFSKPVLLHDVHMRLLAWALRRWLNRCEASTQHHGTGAAYKKPTVGFAPHFDWSVDGEIAWVKRRGGVPFTEIERLVIWWSFRFRRESS